MRAFEAAARRHSFKLAAEELAVTPSAISQQIRALEEDLGVKLFVRSARAVSLTEAGLKLQPKLTSAFLEMRDAVDQIRPRDNEPLRVKGSGPVISKWLLPRLHQFAEKHPEIAVTIGTGHELSDPHGREVLIRFNETPGLGVHAIKLCDEVLLPLANPELVARLNLSEAKDMIRAPLIHLARDPVYAASPDWQAWFTMVGLDPRNAQHGMQFDSHSADNAIDAALNGAGVVLGRRFLASMDLAEGRLVSPFGPIIPMNVSYFVLCQAGEETCADIAAFMNWVQDEVAAMPLNDTRVRA